MSTEFLTNDIRFLQSRAHSTITLDSGSSDVSSITFTSGSNNISSPTTASTYYTSLNHLFYNKHSNGNIGMYYYESGYNRIPMHKNKFNDNGIVINVSADRYGEYVKPGTFSYYDSSNDVDFILRDDGYGNLYSVDPQLTQSSTTSISSSDNYIGNIFYEHGIAVVTETGSYNSSGSGQFCWTVAAGITTYTGETYDSDYATAQGVTPVASGEGTTNARLKCGSSVSGKGFATEIIDHFGEDATFVGFMNYGELDVATDTGISGIELAGNMLQADNTIATNEDHSRRIAQIYRYATPVVITENTNSFKLKVTTYSSVSIDMATDANASHRIYGAKVGGDPFIIEVETGTAE